MKVTEFEIQGPKLIELRTFGDGRGFFVERYRKDLFSEIGLPATLVQDNFSRSQADVLRGLHYQFDAPQGKLVTALSGRIFDVAVDIRKNSSTFGQYVSVEIDGQRPAWFWIPPGFAHGFLVLSPEGADVMYKVDAYYNAKGEAGIAWNDRELAVAWPKPNPLLSEKDAAQPGWGAYRANPKF